MSQIVQMTLGEHNLEQEEQRLFIYLIKVVYKLHEIRQDKLQK